jgi:peroxiredoxin
MRPWGLLLALTLAWTGCASEGEGPAGAEPGAEAAPKPKKSRLRRFNFADRPSNQTTGGRLESKKSPTAFVGRDGQPVPLASFRGKPLVLVFMRGFPGFICPYCTTYTAQIAARYDEIKATGAEVVVVYPTKEEDASKIEEFVAAADEILAEEGEDAIPFPVVLDPGTKIVKKYRLEGDLSRPSTFVLDPKGTIRYAYVGKNSGDRPAVDRIVQEVEALTQGGE